MIHTDGGFYGFKGHKSSVSFFPNGGSRYQPTCSQVWNEYSFFTDNDSGPLGYCSHWQSWIFYAETVRNETLYPARKCVSWENFKEGKCDSNSIAYMGYAASMK